MCHELRLVVNKNRRIAVVLAAVSVINLSGCAAETAPIAEAALDNYRS